MLIVGSLLRRRSPTVPEYSHFLPFDYDPSRSAEAPARLLEGDQGYLMTDGYNGYNRIARTVGILYRIEQIAARQGVPLARSTLGE